MSPGTETSSTQRYHIDHRNRKDTSGPAYPCTHVDLVERHRACIDERAYALSQARPDGQEDAQSD